MSIKRIAELYIDDIFDAIKKIEKYIEGFNFDSFSQDQKTVDAVIRNFEIIGEAAKNIPLEARKKYSQIPWMSMAGTRDKLIHEYFGVNFKVLWKTIKEDLPYLKEKISEITKS